MSFEGRVAKRSSGCPRYMDTMIRFFVVLVLAGAAMLPAWAKPPAQNFWTHSGQAQARGVVHAVVVSVDYGRGLLVVRSGGRMRTIRILPSTTIVTKSNVNGALVDIRAGSAVDAYVSEISGEIVAQLVRIH